MPTKAYFTEKCCYELRKLLHHRFPEAGRTYWEKYHAMLLLPHVHFLPAFSTDLYQRHSSGVLAPELQMKYVLMYPSGVIN